MKIKENNGRLKTNAPRAATTEQTNTFIYVIRDTQHHAAALSLHCFPEQHRIAKIVIDQQNENGMRAERKYPFKEQTIFR